MGEDDDQIERDEESIEYIDNAVHDLATKLLWDDRKEDEDLPRGVIEDLIERQVVTVDAIVETFRDALTTGLRG